MNSEQLVAGNQCGQAGLAALFGMGLLDSAEMPAFETHLNACDLCLAEVGRAGELAVALADTIPPVAPPPDLRKKVLATATLPKGVEALVRAGEMRWRPTPFTGVTYKPLFVDPIGGQAASLVRLEAGAVYPAHRHTEVEHSFILEGDAVFDDHTLFAGDYEAAGAGRRHSSITSKTGCVVFLLHNRHDEVFVH